MPYITIRGQAIRAWACHLCGGLDTDRERLHRHEIYEEQLVESLKVPPSLNREPEQPKTRRGRPPIRN